MNDHYSIGLDIHKKSIPFVIKTKEGELVRQGRVEATHPALTAWAVAIDRPWIGALEATMFSGWVYDELRPRAQRLDFAHPLMLMAITCSKKKTTASMPTKSATCCAAICCRAVTWRRPRFASCGACCAIATCWCAKRCA